MLSEIKLEDNEDFNIERLMFLIHEQRKLQSIGCDLFLMSSKSGIEEISDQDHLYLYKEGKEEEKFYYKIKGKYEKQYLTLAKDKNTKTALKETAFDQEITSLKKCNNIQICEAVLAETSKKGHTQSIKNADKSEIKDDVPHLENLVNQALKKEKPQWRLILLLLTSPSRLSQECIDELTKFKHQIITSENLKTKTSFGQYVIEDISKEVEDKTSNLSRLAHKSSGYLPARKLGYFTQKPVGTLGKIFVEEKERSKGDFSILKEKINHIEEVLVKCANIDAKTVSLRSRQAVQVFDRLLNDYLGSNKLLEYNPLLLIFEVFALLADKGYNKPLNKKNQSEIFNAIKIIFDSFKKKGRSLAIYRGKFSLHIQFYSDNKLLLGTVLHEFVHALCQIIYNNISTKYKIKLDELAEELRSFYHSQNGGLEDNILKIFQGTYAKEKYAAEIFPRIAQSYLLNPNFCPSSLYPKDIASKMNNLFSRFLRDVSEFKGQLLELQKNNVWSRLQSSNALENKEYKAYFSIVRPENQRQMNEWPHFSNDAILVKMALENGFSVFKSNKFKKYPLEVALEGKYPNVENALNILQTMWEQKKIFLPEGVDLNKCDESGKSLLMRAILDGRNPDFISWLIVEGNVNVGISAYCNVYNSDMTAEGYARYSRIKGMDKVRKLIELYMEPGRIGTETTLIPKF